MRRSHRFILSALYSLVLQACNPLGDAPITDPNYHPGSTGVLFENNYSFNPSSASQYNFDSTQIDFNNGYAELTPASQSDSSNVTNGFLGGSSIGTVWNSTSGSLTLDQGGSATDMELDPSWTPAWSDIVGYWKLNESSGNFIDSSGKGNSGTPSGGVTMGVAGFLNSAASFDGSSGYIDMGNPTSLQITGSITLQAWFKTTVSADNNFRVISKSPDNFSGTTTSYVLNLNPHQGNFQFWLNIGGTEYQAATCSSGCHNYADGYWHHWVGTYDGSNLKEYMDAELVSTVPASGSIVNGAEDFVIGATAVDNDNYFQGSIDDVAVWKTALSADAVAMIYQHESAKYAGTFTSRVMDGLSPSANWTNLSWIPTFPFFKELPDNSTSTPASETPSNYSSLSAGLMNGIVGLWHLDEASSASVVLDSSGNGNNGTLNSGVTLGNSGKFGNAAFMRSSQGIDVGDSASLQLTAAVTLAGWFNTNDVTTPQGIVARSASGSGTDYELRYNTGSGSFDFTSYINGGQYDALSWGFGAISPGVWYHIVGVYDGTYLKVYVNGNIAGASGPVAGAMANYDTHVFIGNRGDDEIPLNGRIDEVAIWSRALGDGTNGTPNEIYELYRRGANRIKYQVRSCADASCSASPAWQGPDNTNQTYFSELNNTALNISGAVQAGLPGMLFSNFTSPALSVASNRYFQYRAIMESDDTSSNCNYGSGTTWCAPELKSVSVGPGHYDTTNPTISNNTGLNYSELTSFIETLGAGGCASGTLYNLSPDNLTWYYWTGAAWGIADGSVSKANTAAVVASDLSSFATQLGSGKLYYRTFLQSSGTSSCAISNLEIDGVQ